MDRYSIKWSLDVAPDIENICNQVLDVSKSSASSEKAKRKILDSIATLEYAPQRGGVVGRDKYGGIVRRLSTCKPYTILFTVYDDDKIVRINRVLYSRRNITMRNIKD